ncbi:MAG: hypothetical protein ACOYY2_10065 [Actinomycetota bacterium]
MRSSFTRKASHRARPAVPFAVVLVLAGCGPAPGAPAQLAPATPGPVAGPQVCRVGQLDLSITWSGVGTGLDGLVTAANRSAQPCRLGLKPVLEPLGLDGEPLRTRFMVTTEGLVGADLLRPGETRAARAGWAGWCGPAASGSVRVSWPPGGAVVVPAGGPRQPGCPGPGQPTNLWSSWFLPAPARS